MPKSANRKSPVTAALTGIAIAVAAIGVIVLFTMLVYTPPA